MKTTKGILTIIKKIMVYNNMIKETDILCYKSWLPIVEAVGTPFKCISEMMEVDIKTIKSPF